MTSGQENTRFALRSEEDEHLQTSGQEVRRGLLGDMKTDAGREGVKGAPERVPEARASPVQQAKHRPWVKPPLPPSL